MKRGRPASPSLFPFPAVLLGVPHHSWPHARRPPGHRRPSRRRRAHLRRHPAQGGGRRVSHRRSSTSPPAKPAPAAAPTCAPKRRSARPRSSASTERRNAGLPDAHLAQQRRGRAASWSPRSGTSRPRVVILPFPVGRHPDHRVASELGRDACFLAGLASTTRPATPHRPAQDPVRPRPIARTR